MHLFIEKGSPMGAIVTSTFQVWKSLRRLTADHSLSHDCPKCKERRKLGAELKDQIPYASPTGREKK